MPNSDATEPATDQSSIEDRAAFLARDFDQAFEEKRRLEDQVWDICKFGFTAHSALLGVAIGAYRYSLNEGSTDFVPAAIAVLAVAFLVGVFLVFLMVRTRVYFVRVSRYINAHRPTFAPKPGWAEFSTWWLCQGA